MTDVDNPDNQYLFACAGSDQIASKTIQMWIAPARVGLGSILITVWIALCRICDKYSSSQIWIGAHDRVEVKFKLNIEPPPHHHPHPAMSRPADSMTLQHLRRRVVDYDSQIRQGLEDGNVRQVVKRLGNDLVSKKKIV